MSEHILPSKLYWAIWAILICLTVVTALVATVDLGWLNPVAALLIATGKATIVVLFFMHVKYTSEKLTDGHGDCLRSFLAADSPDTQPR